MAAVQDAEQQRAPVGSRDGWSAVRALERSVPQVDWSRGQLIGISLIINLFALGLPVFILQVYDRVLPHTGITSLHLLVLGLLAVIVIDAVMRLIRAQITTWNGARFEHLARCQNVARILNAPIDRLMQESPGAYFDKINAINQVRDFYSSQIAGIMVDLPFALFFLVLIWYLGGPLVLVPICLLVAFGCCAGLVGLRLRTAVVQRVNLDQKRYDLLNEILSNVQTVKSLGLKELMLRRLERMQEKSALSLQKVTIQSMLAQSIGSLFSQLNMVAVVGVGALMVLDGALSVGELAACMLLSGRSMQPLQSAMSLWTNFQSIRVAAGRATDVLDLPQTSVGRNLPQIPPLRGEIELRDVTYLRPGTDEPKIHDLSLKVRPGEAIGIEGDNASGRSTLLRILRGLVRPQHGCVLVDGHDLFEFDPASLHQQIALVEQDVTIFSGTIIENLTNFRGGALIDEALELAEKLGLDQIIKRLANGYDTRVGDGSAAILTGGMRQRIAIVRALVNRPAILLFDEASAALDHESERRLHIMLEEMKGRTTMIIVSPRPALLRLADRRFVMTDGRLMPRGQTPQPVPSSGEAS